MQLWPVWADDEYLVGFVKFMQARLYTWTNCRLLAGFNYIFCLLTAYFTLTMCQLSCDLFADDMKDVLCSSHVVTTLLFHFNFLLFFNYSSLTHYLYRKKASKLFQYPTFILLKFLLSLPNENSWILCKKNSVVDPNPHGFELILVGRTWIGIQEGKTPKKKRVKKFYFEVLNVIFWRLKASSVAWTPKNGGLGINFLIFTFKNMNIFKLVKFTILGFKSLDPDPLWPKMLNPDLDPHWNQCGSTTLKKKFVVVVT